MTDIEIDPDLIRVKREFYALEAQRAAYCARRPAEPTEECRAAPTPYGRNGRQVRG